MKVSYQWLQTYFDAPLPPPEEVAHAFTFHAFEIEELIPLANGDTVIDVKVLPNRSHDCLSHRGLAKELSVILSIPLAHDPFSETPPDLPAAVNLRAEINDTLGCSRLSVVRFQNVHVGPSPEWLRTRLEAIGQRSINNVVDITNYVMFDLGQPLHAFDAARLAGNVKAIGVRSAKPGETLRALDEQEYSVPEGSMLIVDATTDEPLSIAGIKGGALSGISEATTDVVLEAAHFDPTRIRKTSQSIKLRTDASARFENEPSVELISYAVEHAARLFKELAGADVVGKAQVYPKPQEACSVSVSSAAINGRLGTALSVAEIEQLLTRFGFSYTTSGDTFTLTAPFERLDLRIAEDVIEEVGRIYGYENVMPVPLPPPVAQPSINKRFYYAEQIRNFLAANGFSEVYTSSFRNKDEVELASALASDKGFLRSTLTKNLSEALAANIHHAPLFNASEVKIFEIGNVFTKNGEHTTVCIAQQAVGQKKDSRSDLIELFLKLRTHIGVPAPMEQEGVVLVEGMVEFNLDELLAKLPNPSAYPSFKTLTDPVYKPFSPYPAALRDVAVWVPKATSSDTVLTVIKDAAGPLLVNYSLFDSFEKGEQISYAFRLVLQSFEKTLSEEELAAVMDRVYAALSANPEWKIR